MKNAYIYQSIIERYSDEQFLRVGKEDEHEFDEAVIGVEEKSMRLIYSTKKMIRILMSQMKVTKKEADEGKTNGITVSELKRSMAQEHFEFNIAGSYLGEKTPIWCEDDF